MPNVDYVLRPFQSVEDLEACEDIQRQVWGPGDAEVVPINMLAAVMRNGGIAIGAFAAGQMIGFVFGFLATGSRYGPEAPAAVKLKHHSHMLAVLPPWRDSGVGMALKLAQREEARAQALRLMTWTYDPLESRNALFNMYKLGAVCNTYYRDYYGPMRDELNSGLPSDRFQVDWYIASNRVATRLAGRRGRLERASFMSAGAVLVNPAVFDPARPRVPAPAETVGELGSNFCLVEIPADFQAVKKADQGLARAWRMQTREIFTTAFSRGYLVTDYLYESQGPRGFYTLTHTEPETEAGPDWSIFAGGLATDGQDNK